MIEWGVIMGTISTFILLWTLFPIFIWLSTCIIFWAIQAKSISVWPRFKKHSIITAHIISIINILGFYLFIWLGSIEHVSLNDLKAPYVIISLVITTTIIILIHRKIFSKNKNIKDIIHRSKKIWHILITVVIPVATFLASLVFGADISAKEQLYRGSFDLLISGKIWLLPLVIWAAWSYYISRFSRKEKYYFLQFSGLISGMIVSIFSIVQYVIFIYGNIIVTHHIDPFLFRSLIIQIWIIPAFVVIIAYSKMAWKIRKNIRNSLKNWIIFISTHIILASLTWNSSKSYFQKLPDSLPPNDCYVVTAAMYGHRNVVGRKYPLLHKNGLVIVNQQILNFWAFESYWRKKHQYSHSIIRSIYNTMGPLLARCIRHPILADITYYFLKPLEWIVCLILKKVNNSNSSKIKNQHLKISKL